MHRHQLSQNRLRCPDDPKRGDAERVSAEVSSFNSVDKRTAPVPEDQLREAGGSADRFANR